MKKIYLKPVTETIFLISERLLVSHSEQEWDSWIGAKESGDSFENTDEEGNIWSGSNGSGSIWNEDSEEGKD